LRAREQRGNAMRTNRRDGVNYPVYFASHLYDYRKRVKIMPQWNILAQIEVDSNNLPIYEKLGHRDAKIGILGHNAHYCRYLRLRLRMLQIELMRRWPSVAKGSQ